jgi:hypothetical protein
MKFILDVCLMTLFTVFMAVMLVEWASGCGETYTDANGVEHQQQCWILTNHGESK